MNVCKYCGSKNLYLEPRIEGQDVLTADMVSLKCGDCNKWLKWCPKTERQLFILKARKNNRTGRDLLAEFSKIEQELWEKRFFDNEIMRIIKTQDDYCFNEMENAIRGFCKMAIDFNQEKLRKWVNLCLRLDNIDKDALIDLSIRKKFAELHKEIDKIKQERNKYKKALHKDENFQWKVVADLMKTDLEKHKKALNIACVELKKLGFPPVLMSFGLYGEEPEDFAKEFLDQVEKEFKEETKNEF